MTEMDPSTSSHIPAGWTDIGEARPTPPRWLIEGLLPDGLVGITGPAKKSKKSMMVLAMSLMVTGKQVNVFPPFMRNVMVDGRVLYVSAEATAGELADSARHYLKMPKLIPDGSLLIADDPWQFRLDKEDCRKRMMEVMDEVQPVLTIFDPIRRLHSLDENDSGAMSEMMYPFRQWAKERSEDGQPTAVVWMHHPRKLKENATRFTIDDIRGTGDWAGMSDGMLVVNPMLAHWSIEAVFKRATGWTRDIVLGLAGEVAREVITDTDRKVQDVWRPGVDIEMLSDVLRMPLSSVRESVEKLKRNEMLKGGTNK